MPEQTQKVTPTFAERVAASTAPRWGQPVPLKYKQKFQQIADALAGMEKDEALKVPIQELTKSVLRGTRIENSLRSSIFKALSRLGLSSGGVTIRCDDIHAYFIRQGEGK